MEVDDIYDAAVDWLFTEGLEDDTNETHALSREERVQSFISIRSSLSGDPEHVETPNTNSGQTQNLPQPVTKRVQSSFDKYCCICFVVRLLIILISISFISFYNKLVLVYYFRNMMTV